MLSRLFSMQKMADALRAQQVGKGEYRCYVGLWIFGMIFIIADSLGLSDPEIRYEPTYLKIVDLLITYLSIAVTLFVAYRINKQGDTKDFWYRYFSLGFPVSITAVVVAIIIGIIVGLTNLTSLEVVTYTDLMIQLFISVLIIYWTQKYMRYIAGVK